MAVPKPLAILGRIVLDVTIFFFIIVLLPGLPPNVVFESYSVTPAMELNGKLERNTKLNNAEPILSGEITGPESIAVRGHEIYTGLIGGEVIQIKGGVATPIAKFGKPCGGQWDEKNCGRPLGMRFGSDGKLVVVDAYYGLFKVDVDTKKVETLVSSNDTIEDKKLMISNDLDVAKSGTVFWSDSSTNANLQDSLQEFMGEPSGRLLQYDPKTKKTTVLMAGLHFPNGVQLFPNEESVLVSETVRYRVWRYYLKGPKAGQKEIFIDGLPGSPDNIRSNGKGGFFISLVAPRYSDRISLTDILGPLPLVRKFVLRLMAMVDSSLYLIDSIYTNAITQTAQYYVGHLQPVASIMPKHTILVELNQKGDIIGSLQDSTGRVAHISEISLDGTGKLAYLGSPYNTKIWKIDLEAIRSNEHTIKVT